jgi:hypothetical protein
MQCQVESRRRLRRRHSSRMISRSGVGSLARIPIIAHQRESKTLSGVIGEHIVMALESAKAVWLVGAPTNPGFTHPANLAAFAEGHAFTVEYTDMACWDHLGPFKPFPLARRRFPLLVPIAHQRKVAKAQKKCVNSPCLQPKLLRCSFTRMNQSPTTPPEPARTVQRCVPSGPQA